MATAISPERRQILVVDDTDEIRSLCVTVLEGAGLKVQSTFCRADTVRLCKEYDFDLVITDLEMPDREADEKMMASGLLLIKWLKEMRPGMKIILMSGRRREDIVDDPETGILEGTPFLQKPFRPGALLSLVKGVLGIQD